MITPLMELGSDPADTSSRLAPRDSLHIRPLLLQTASHPRVKLHTNSGADVISGDQQKFTVEITKYPRYVRSYLCTSCGRCTEACSVKIPFVRNGQRLIHNAIHASLLGATAVPSAYSIDKHGIAPCTAACPLGINVQGFVSLLAGGKVDKALSLINEAAPLAGVLGRVCTHPCEDNCKRTEVDAPVFIRALHRFAADNASGDIAYTRKVRAGFRKEAIAIVGSGPAGLSAAWELARHGYSPTIFEAHAVAGGMLATGIPRFRLPREVRKREVKAIEDLGVRIRTGVTIGRDVTLPDLRERGYRAFFLAVGAHENRKLNIPGEYLEGVVDSISLLFELNLGVGASVGRNMVIIGGGNAAVDSARTARRKGRRNVTIIYRRTAEEMTAVKEDLDEALKEGISIEYLTSPIEILGDGIRVTGVRCQRMRLSKPGTDGRWVPVPIPESEFVMEADHVVLAIGQRPNTPQLNIRGLRISNPHATIRVNPLTLETGVPGMFAGGDCVTGSNTVVDAMSAGLRAAESIDRYLRGRSIRKGRRLRKPQAFDVNISERYVSPNKRSEMPLIPRLKRMGTYEETSTGLPFGVMEQEAERCLNCPSCSGCMECEQACELGAVLHSDYAEKIEVEVDAIISFASTNGDLAIGKFGCDTPRVDVLASQAMRIHTVKIEEEQSLEYKLVQASSVALEVATQLNLRECGHKVEPESGGTLEAKSDSHHLEVASGLLRASRTGVILCRCGGSISSVIDFPEVSKRMLDIPSICGVWEISQACTEQGALEIASYVATQRPDRVILAACRCCNLKQICFSCTDRRVMCAHYLEQILSLPSGTDLEFVNIREQCAWVHKDDPENATNKASELLSAEVARDSSRLLVAPKVRSVNESILVVGDELLPLAAAKDLAAQGYPVSLVSGPESGLDVRQHNTEYLERRASILKQLREQGISVMRWPEVLEFSGSPGNYEAVLKYGSEITNISVGAIILHLGNISDEAHSVMGTISRQSLLGRVIDHMINHRSLGNRDSQLVIESTLGEKAGIFIVSSDEIESPETEIMTGAAAAAKVWVYMAQGTLYPQVTAVNIDSKLCRGCGECALICPYIEMERSATDSIFAYVDPALCLGCGACIARCPSGAISQPLQGDDAIASMMDGLLGGGEIMSEVV